MKVKVKYSPEVMEKILENKENNISYNLMKGRGLLTSMLDYELVSNPKEREEINHDPFQLKNMRRAVELFKKHIENNSKILVIQDSDADGLCSAAIMINFITNFCDREVSYKIHESKAHGLESHYLEIIDEEFDFVIVPDAGSNDIKYHQALKEHGIDILVLDHHIINEKLIPDIENYENAVIVNCTDGVYKNPHLSGGGVVLKFIQALDYEDKSVNAGEFVDLAALSIISDMMPVVNPENSYIIRYGLKNIRNSGFVSILKAQEFSTKGILTPLSIAFYVTPLINGLIRVGTMEQKDFLLQAFINGEKSILSNKRGAAGDEMETVGEQNARNCINCKNKQNREKEKAIEQLKIQIVENCLDENKILILNGNELSCPRSIMGLCAMGICAETKIPTLLGRENNGVLSGSIRNCDNNELKNFREFLLDSKLMEYVEGHNSAAGFSIKTSNLEKLTKYANEKLKDVDFKTNFYEVDFSFNNEESIVDIIFNICEHSLLWGQGNPEPIIHIKDMIINPKDIKLRSKGTYIFKHNNVDFIKFFSEEEYNEICKFEQVKISIIGTCSINNFRGVSSPQILLKEVDFYEFIDDSF